MSKRKVTANQPVRQKKAVKKPVPVAKKKPVKAPAKKAEKGRVLEHKPKPAAGKKSKSAAEKPAVVEVQIPIGEAMRQAVEKLGPIAIDPSLAVSQLEQLGEYHANVVRMQAAYDERAEAAKTAKKSLEAAQEVLIDQVKRFTRKAPMPLFDRVQKEQDLVDMAAAPQAVAPAPEAAATGTDGGVETVKTVTDGGPGF